MADNHHIDITISKVENEVPFKLEMSETSCSLTADLGKLEFVSFTDDLLTFSFANGQICIDMTLEDIKQHISEKTKKE